MIGPCVNPWGQEVTTNHENRCEGFSRSNQQNENGSKFGVRSKSCHDLGAGCFVPRTPPSAPLVTHSYGGKYVPPAHTENRPKRDLSVHVGDEAWAKMAHWSLGRAMNAQRGVIKE